MAKTLRLDDEEEGALRALISIALDAGEVAGSARAKIERVLAKIDRPARQRGPSRRAEQRAADRIDGYDRDDLGESPDY
jgi:hypothetical protein